MTTIAAPKSSAQNRLEGLALTAILQGLTTFAAAVMIIKLAGASEIVTDRGGAAIFVALASIVYALIMPKLAAWFPRMTSGYEPLFYDARLTVSDKIAQWRAQPKVSLQLMTTAIMLSVLAVAVVSRG